MKNITKRIISMLLTVCLLFLATVPVFAVEDEEYLADLRIIYADDYTEATEILAASGLEGYKLLNANLNANTGKTGTWLAYKTTTDIEDAITDISVMQMNGGYNEGNYQQMIKQSLEEYEKMGANYLSAIDYFREGYEAGNYLSQLAFRQLNFYNVVTEGTPEIPDFEGERLGDIFIDGIDSGDLATMFMEGNIYALDNIRSLIAMGVSYNEDGLTYLEKVADEAEKYSADNSIYQNEDYKDVAGSIASTISAFRTMFKEYEAYEAELNYEDEDFTDLEIKYIEYMYIAKLMRGVSYLNGKTLYQFIMEYESGSENYSEIYPLVAALNEGQLAMTKVNHYYDVVRYSVAIKSSEALDEELNAAEEKYGDNPFNVYEGVDRTIFHDTFALTSAAYRSDAFTESGLAAYLWGANQLAKFMNISGIFSATILALTGVAHHLEKSGVTAAKKLLNDYSNKCCNTTTMYTVSRGSVTHNELLNYLGKTYKIGESYDKFLELSALEKMDLIDEYLVEFSDGMGAVDARTYNDIKLAWADYQLDNPAVRTANEAAHNAQASYAEGVGTFYGLYLVGGIMTLISAIRLCVGVYNYYHPTYDDIPTAMVDLIDTPDGDRYIKYDVVYEAETKNGGLVAADLNAFQANRWNALYFTKSYEAGKPLLADEFVVSNNNNVPAENYAPVHRFGEVVSYNLNKYNFNDDHSIFLSVKQSDNQKSAVADVPELIGSVFGTGYYILAGGVGALLGVGGTIGTKEIIKRRKSKKENPDIAEDDNQNA